MQRTIAAGAALALLTGLASSLGGDDGVPARRGPSDVGVVLEAFADGCFSCHGAEKAKAGLRLDEADGLLSVVIEGDPDASELLRRVRLPDGHDELMPPSGVRITDDVASALERWIAAGAPLVDVGAELEAARAARRAAALVVDDVRAQSGARIAPIALDLERPPAQQRFVADWSHVPAPATRERLAALAPIADRVHEIALAGTAVGADALAGLPALPGLRRAHLERTALGDAAVRVLVERAPGLAYVNLHSTRVTAGALEALGRLAGLERVVLFGTEVSEADVERFRAAHPNVRVTTGGAALPEADPFGARQPRRILAADASKGRIALLREVTIGHPELLWEHPIRNIHDLAWLGSTVEPHGRVLFQESWTRVVEVDTATGETLWSYDAAAHGEGPVEVHSFERLADGTTMVAESGRARLVIVSPEGEIVHVIPLQVERPDPHHDTRLVRSTPTGTFLVAHEAEGVAREYDRDGNVVWEYRVPLFAKERAPGHGIDAHGNQLFAAVRLADGDTLVTTGNGSSLLRVGPDGALRWRRGQNDIEGVTLAWTTTVQELESGNLVLGNCHAGPDNAQIVELTADGERVWSFRDFERFGDALSNSWIIEEAK